MLRCDKCDYELTGLVRNSAPVRCPECGTFTPHRDGRSITPFRGGRWYWACVFGPSLLLLVVMMTGRMAALVTRQDLSRFDTALPLVGWLGVPVFSALGLCVLLTLKPQGSPMGSVAELWMIAMLLSPASAIAVAPIGALLPGMLVYVLR